MNEEIKLIIGDYESFLDKIFENTKNSGFDFEDFIELDHIAYRTESVESYEEIKNKLIKFSISHDELNFGWRNVLVCRLKTPLIYDRFMIGGVEVLAPKENNEYKEGLEHAEFVIKTTLPEFKEKYKNIDFNLKAYDREGNPELIVDFENCAVKFHTQSLLEVRKLIA